MERMIGGPEPTCGGTINHKGRGGAIQLFPTSAQLSTKSCARCAGLLVSDWYYGANTTGEHPIETFRCVQCGHRVDPVILKNQIRPPIEIQQARQV